MDEEMKNTIMFIGLCAILILLILIAVLLLVHNRMMKRFFRGQEIQYDATSDYDFVRGNTLKRHETFEIAGQVRRGSI